MSCFDVNRTGWREQRHKVSPSSNENDSRDVDVDHAGRGIAGNIIYEICGGALTSFTSSQKGKKIRRTSCLVFLIAALPESRGRVGGRIIMVLLRLLLNVAEIEAIVIVCLLDRVRAVIEAIHSYK